MIEVAVLFLRHLLVLALKGYLAVNALAITIFLVLVAATRICHEKSKFTYYAKFFMIYYSTVASVGLLCPFLLLRPRNVKNFCSAGYIVRPLAALLGMTYEVRNAKYISERKAAIVVANHQSSLDITTMFGIWFVAKGMTVIGKKFFLYVFPFGQALWLCGMEFIDRKNPKQSYKQLEDLSAKIKRENLKLMLFPEGTRNKNSGMLPFKKGAFVTAVSTQCPIIPMVLSPYHFIDSKKKTFEKGHLIIEMLPPIPTKGKKTEDIEDLMNETRDKMLEAYNRLSKELDVKRKDPKWMNKQRQQVTILQ